MRTLTGIVLGCLMINLVIAAAGQLAIRCSWLAANLAAVALGVAMVVLSFSFRQGAWAWAALIAMVAAVLAGMNLREIRELQGRPVLRDLDLADAARHPEAAGFYFRQGVVRADLFGSYDSSQEGASDGASATYEVAPVVPEDWSPGEPVFVWAVDWNMPNPRRHWELPLRAGLRVGSMFRDGYLRAAQDAMARHGLQSPPDRVLIRWVPSPETAREDYWQDYWTVVKIWNAIYAAGLLLYWAYQWLSPLWSGRPSG